MSAPIPTEAELLAVAHAAADAASAELTARFGRAVDVSTKSTDTDPVSEADLAAEAAIRAVLADRRPGDAILGEEGGLTAARAGAEPTGLRWIVDPLDGTVNYLYGIPHFAVSVAVEDADGALAGVVVDPIGAERFAATRSGPAQRWSGTPETAPLALAPRSETRLEHALIATGLSYDSGVRALQGEVLAGLAPRVRDIRRAGAAALDLCGLAAGRCDAYFERGVKPWDIAAGVLLCRRVGLELAHLPAVPAGASSPVSAALPEGIVVAPGAFLDELVRLVSGPSV